MRHGQTIGSNSIIFFLFLSPKKIGQFWQKSNFFLGENQTQGTHFFYKQNRKKKQQPREKKKKMFPPVRRGSNSSLFQRNEIEYQDNP